MFSAEELHPAADRVRHAQVIAALQNGPLTRKYKKLWVAADFIRDPWEPPKPKARLTAAQIAQQVASVNAMRRSGGRQ